MKELVKQGVDKALASRTARKERQRVHKRRMEIMRTPAGRADLAFREGAPFITETLNGQATTYLLPDILAMGWRVHSVNTAHQQTSYKAARIGDSIGGTFGTIKGIMQNVYVLERDETARRYPLTPLW